MDLLKSGVPEILGSTRIVYSMRPSVPPPHQKSPALIKKGKLVWMMKSGRDAAEKELGVEPIASASHSRGCGAKHAANLPWWRAHSMFRRSLVNVLPGTCFIFWCGEKWQRTRLHVKLLQPGCTGGDTALPSIRSNHRAWNFVPANLDQSRNPCGRKYT